MDRAADLNRIAYEFRGAGLEVHRRVGPGCFESAYTPCLAQELRRRGLEFRTKVPLGLRYDDLYIPCAYEADLIIEGSIIGEVKAIERLAPVHSRQLRTYLCLSGCPLGFILNFGATRFLDGVLRLVNNFPHGTTPHGPTRD